MSLLTADHISQLDAKLSELDQKHDRLMMAFSSRRYVHPKADEYARHGYLRRLGTLRRCINNVFMLIPPETLEMPNKATLADAQINVQAFFANVYGCIDNLAWVWSYERRLNLPRSRVGLRSVNTELRASLSDELQTYLKTLDAWFEYLIEYRDALAHRIPLYIPPGGVPERHVASYNDLSSRISEALYVRGDPREYERLTTEQASLLVFQPFITHSVEETSAPFAFHAQMIADFLTVEELGYKMLDELDAIQPTSSVDEAVDQIRRTSKGLNI